ncbi:MAG: hypothetical protein QM761_01775 [Pseudoxanthomonas sp.]
MKFEYLFWVCFVGVLAHLAWRYFRSGRSLTGAMLGGRIKREIGEIPYISGPTRFSGAAHPGHGVAQG